MIRMMIAMSMLHPYKEEISFRIELSNHIKKKLTRYDRQERGLGHLKAGCDQLLQKVCLRQESLDANICNV